jgi:2-polyprenyl-6-methoxyphenol hydroxylase-like FAD-dependent oxidoreductase
MPTDRHRHDVVVVGARAAGAATALLLSRLGHDVVLLDRAVFPADTLSTHQIARTGVVQLQRWGLLQAVLGSGAPAIRQVTFTSTNESITRAIKHKAGVDLLVAPRRYLLDTIVAEAAAGAGADVRFGVTVAGVRLDDAGRATGVYGHDSTGAAVDIDARFVVGADGLRSRVARSVGAPPPSSPPSTRSRQRRRQPSSSFAPTTNGSAVRTAEAPSTPSTASAKSAPTSTPSTSTPTTPPSWSDATTVPRRWSSCCTRSPPA